MDTEHTQTILIAGDEAAVAAAGPDALRGFGYGVIVSPGCAGAADIAALNPGIGLVIMGLGAGSGTDAVAAAKAVLAVRDIPLIFLAERAGPELLEQAAALPAYGIITCDSGPGCVRAAIAMSFRLAEARGRERLAHLRELGSRTLALNERVKELTCLYGVSRLMERKGDSLDELLQGIAELLPPAYQFPEIACARIVLEGREFKSCDFIDSALKQGRPIMVHGIKAGVVEVCYRAPDAESGAAPPLFLREEDDLLGVIAERLGRVIERRRAEDALLESEGKYRVLLDESMDPIFSFERDGTYRFVNRAFAAPFGKDPAKIIGKKIWDIFPKDEADKRFAVVRRVFETGETVVFEVRVPLASGDRFYITSVKPVKDDRGDVVTAICISKEITERKRMEDSLREREVQMRSIFAALPVGIAILHDRVFRTVNDELCRMTGYAADEMLGRGIRFLYPDDAEFKKVGNAYGMLETSDVITIESRWVRKSGNIIDVLLSGAFLDRAAPERGNTFIAYDITGRKLTEEAIRESGEKFRIMANYSYDWEYWRDSDEKIVYMSPSCGMFSGYRAEEFIARPALLEDIIHPDDRKLYADHMTNFYNLEAGSSVLDFRIITRSGETRWISHVCRTVFRNDGTWHGRRVSNRDITDRKAAEEALRASKTDLEKAQSVAHIGSWKWDIRSNRLEWSDEMYRIFGVDKNAFTGSLGDVIAASIHPDDRARVEDSNRSVVAEKKPVPLEYRVVRGDGTVRTVWAEAGELILGGDGAPSVLTGIVQDITDRKAAEEALTGALAEKNALFLELQHRVKNTIAMIASLVGIEAGRSDDAAVVGVLKAIRGRVVTLGNLYSMLTGPGGNTVVRLDEYLRQIADSITTSLLTHRDVAITTDFTDMSLDVKRAAQVGLIVNELVTNALKHAIPEQGSGVIGLKLAKKGTTALISVSDSGPGIPRDFDMENSNGLGMKLVRMLVAQSGGTIAYDNAGPSTFTVTIPLD